MDNITQITSDIIRLTVPFQEIYTTVCIIRTPKGSVLFDTATYNSDVPEYILPVLKKLQVQDLKYIVISHNHGDHAGGLEQLARILPDVTIVSLHEGIFEKYSGRVLSPADGEMLLDVLSVIAIPGHTADSIGVLDTRTGTLISGDSLQVYGIYGSEKWGSNISFPIQHMTALAKLHALEINTILASHDYHPYGYIAQGNEAVAAYINACKEALLGIKAFICAHPELDDNSLESVYVAETGLPIVGSHVFAAIRDAMNSCAI